MLNLSIERRQPLPVSMHLEADQELQLSVYHSLQAAEQVAHQVSFKVFVLLQKL